MYIVGGSFFTRAAADADEFVGEVVYSNNEIWTLEEKEIPAPEPAEGEEPQEPTKGYCWSKIEAGGISMKLVAPCLSWSKADVTNGTFPWAETNSLVMSGGMSDNGVTHCELFYCKLDGGALEWNELREPLWEEPTPRTQHAVRLEQPRAVDGVKQPATLITTGGYKWCPGDGWWGTGAWREQSCDNSTWSVAEDNTTTSSHLEPVSAPLYYSPAHYWCQIYNLFRRAEVPSADEFCSLPHDLNQRDEKHLSTWMHWAAHSGSANIASYLLNKCGADPWMRDRQSFLKHSEKFMMNLNHI